MQAKILKSNLLPCSTGVLIYTNKKKTQILHIYPVSSLNNDANNLFDVFFSSHLLFFINIFILLAISKKDPKVLKTAGFSPLKKDDQLHNDGVQQHEPFRHQESPNEQ